MQEYQPDRLTYWWGASHFSYVTDDFGNAADINIDGEVKAYQFFVSGLTI